MQLWWPILSPNSHKFVMLYFCWDIPSESTGLWQLQKVSSAFKFTVMYLFFVCNNSISLTASKHSVYGLTPLNSSTNNQQVPLILLFISHFLKNIHRGQVVDLAIVGFELAKLIADFKITGTCIAIHNLLIGCAIHKPMFVCESLACANFVFMLFPCSGFPVGKSGYFVF